MISAEIYDKNNTIYALDRRFRVDWDGFKLSKQPQDFFGSHGGYVTGDGTAGVSNIRLDYWRSKRDQDEFILEARALNAYLLAKNDPYYLRVTTDGGEILRFLIDISSHRNKMDGELAFYLQENSIELFSLDHFPERETAISLGPVEMFDGDILDLPNTGDLITFPVITVEALSPLPQFLFTNVTNGLFFLIDDLGFTPPRSFVFDWINDRITLATIERSRSLSSGGPISLERGNNQLRFNGASSVNVSATYREILTVF